MTSTANSPADGCRIAYAVRGQGPAILFIQGVGVQGDGWRPQIDPLATRFTCVTFDNRGVGQTPWGGEAITVEQMAGDALAVLGAAGINRADVVGHSLGGLTAMQLALSARNKVRSLSLLCTFPSGRMAAPLTPSMVWLGLRSRLGTRRMRRRGFLKLVLPPGPIADAEGLAVRLAGLFGHDLADQPPVVGRQLRAMREADLTARLGDLAGLPTLILGGPHDQIAPRRAGRALHKGIPGSRYLEVRDASHGLPITHANLVNSLLVEHLVGACRTGEKT